MYFYLKLRIVRLLNLNIKTRVSEEIYLTENWQIIVAVFHISRCLDIHIHVQSKQKNKKSCEL